MPGTVPFGCIIVNDVVPLAQQLLLNLLLFHPIIAIPQLQAQILRLWLDFCVPLYCLLLLPPNVVFK